MIKMKQTTLKKIKFMKRLMARPKRAVFWINDNKLYFTYPSGGWLDDTLTADEAFEYLESVPTKIIMGNVNLK